MFRLATWVPLCASLTIGANGLTEPGSPNLEVTVQKARTSLENKNVSLVSASARTDLVEDFNASLTLPTMLDAILRRALRMRRPRILPGKQKAHRTGTEHHQSDMPPLNIPPAGSPFAEEGEMLPLASMSMLSATMLATAANLAMNVVDILWLATFIEHAGPLFCTVLYIGTTVLTCLLAWIVRDQLLAAAERYPSVSIGAVTTDLGPFMLLATFIYLVFDYIFAPKEDEGPELEKAIETPEHSHNIGFKLKHLILVTIASCAGGLSLDFWFFFNERMTLEPIVLGSVLGCLGTMVLALSLAAIPIFMHIIDRVPLFVFIGILTALAFVDIIT